MPKKTTTLLAGAQVAAAALKQAGEEDNVNGQKMAEKSVAKGGGAVGIVHSPRTSKMMEDRAGKMPTSKKMQSFNGLGEPVAFLQGDAEDEEGRTSYSYIPYHGRTFNTTVVCIDPMSCLVGKIGAKMQDSMTEKKQELQTGIQTGIGNLMNNPVSRFFPRPEPTQTTPPPATTTACYCTNMSECADPSSYGKRGRNENDAAPIANACFAGPTQGDEVQLCTGAASDCNN
ncbi:unnamed protein product [Amoebophrya sp. A120]|nr:unnamed protein product [Amoebophrya sp. A120]|eukprot:GSA120T00014834001.1